MARVLSERELNRTVLARQMLLERATLSPPRALERMGGLQAQYAPSMYIGLWSRLADFERDALTRALERRTVVQGTLMRVTIHLVSKRDWWPMAIGTRRARRDGWLQYHKGDPSEKQLVALAAKLRRRLEGGPATRAEVSEIVGKGAPTNGVGQWLDMVRVPPSGTWERRRADLFGLAEDWVGRPSVSPAEGIELLVRRYLGGFGPATRADVANWAGLTPKAIDAALERAARRRFRAEDGAELYDLPRAPLADPETPVPVRFLPTWDATLLVHARRSAILPEAYRKRVFNTKTPQSMPTFLVDGQVAGSWRYEKGKVALNPFHRLDAATRRELKSEADRLAEFHA